MKLFRSSSVAVFLLVFGCTEPNPAYDPDPFLPGECRSGVSFDETFEAFEKPSMIDVLIVVDDSGGVEEMQTVLGDAMPSFLETLAADGADVEVAVAPTSMDGGAAIASPVTNVPGCETNTTRIASSETMENWQRIAACNVQLGGDSDAFGEPLLVAESLLESTGDVEFFREKARRVIVLATKEDDCSSEEELSSNGVAREVCADNEDELVDPAGSVARMRESVATPEGLVLAVLGGPPSARASEGDAINPVCSASLGSVYPGNRLFEAVATADGQGELISLCSDELRGPLVLLAEDVVDTGVTVCPQRELEHEPLSVSVTEIDGDDPVHIGPGDEGFVYLGPTEGCATGGLWFSPEALEDAERIDVEYCTEAQ